jgi:hypothetical protein
VKLQRADRLLAERILSAISVSQIKIQTNKPSAIARLQKFRGIFDGLADKIDFAQTTAHWGK